MPCTAGHGVHRGGEGRAVRPVRECRRDVCISRLHTLTRALLTCTVFLVQDSGAQWGCPHRTIQEERVTLAPPPEATLSTEGLTGYDTHDRYFASRFTQGDRKVYSLDLPLVQIAATFPRPDPGHPAEGNRRVDPKHAHRFADYIRRNPNWVSPALMLRSADIYGFDVRAEVGGAQFGVLAVPRALRAELKILDGQHRILGIHMAVEEIAEEIRRVRDLVAMAKRNGDDTAVVKLHETTVRKLEGQLLRLTKERISVGIVIEDQESAYKLMFATIAENAKGITKTIQARFDSSKVVNRVMLQLVAEHPLLMNRVEEQVDRVTSEDQLMAATHVAEVVRAAAIGFGRMVPAREEAMDDRDVLAKAEAFLRVLTAAYPDIRAIQDGAKKPGAVRAVNMLGTATMLRVLAGTYHELHDPAKRDAAKRGSSPPTPAPMSDEDIIKFLASLDPHMKVPVSSNLWKVDADDANNVVQQGAGAPRSRGGDVRRLTEQLVRWAREGLPPV